MALFVGPDSRECGTCGEVKSLDQFRSRGERNGVTLYRSTCKPCEIAYNKTWVARRGRSLAESGPSVAEADCKDCGERKPVDQFSPQASSRTGVRSVCKPCNSERTMQRRDKNPDRDLDAHLRRTFGITLDQYNEMVEAQNGVCAICGEPPTIVMGVKSRRQGRAVRPRLVVDHCHETGKIRGLLCTPCNRGIGFLNDDPKRVLAALEYLEGGQ